ncbi:ABC transporter ATP-binding protein [Aristaeella hokkaidonensis]|uniref:ABC transporter ATP-binding protein n=1 Tax=Aristaeella hokkaidonensis TaxID=3046382 RepID=A0AC61N6E3_9FIRM|nr:ABC transporter ATP-binding protein [Aristaeella hokkaidonensis]QUC66056.1 ABC transporter ATP-binding protein [Aristaeella hokkaidonensis]SNT93713.1 ATP-binding cassette, subfamily B [Aristaeella hokkaidonensis]
MFWKNVQRKYALTDHGVKNIQKGTLWTVIVNLVVICGMGILYKLMSGFMDTLTKGSPLPSLLLFIGVTALFLVISYTVHLQQYRATYGLVYGEVKDVRIGLAERLRRLPLGYFGKHDLADLTETLMGDVNRLEHVWSHCLSYLYGSAISTAIIAAGMLAYDWRMALACLWGVPVAFGLLFGSRKVYKKRSEENKKSAVRVADGIQETLENIREIRATNQENRFLEELNEKIDRNEKIMRKGELTIGIFVNLASVIMRLGVATTILTGTSLILGGKVDFMVLFMFLLAITRIYAPFDQALALIAEMFVSQVSANRLQEVHDTPTAEGTEVFMPKGHDIEFRNVSFAYDNQEVLSGVSFTAKEGEVTALVGPSGSGKSTCARVAARLWDVDKGSVLVGGVDISGVDPEVLLSDYSMVFQDVVLFDDTVMENIRLGKYGATDEEVLAAAKAANCDEFVEKLPNGYATPIGENGAKLSGGERQRISIARALLKDAPIVLLDEATASLDVENETKVQGALSRLLTGKTVLVIAHRMRTVEAADKIVVLADGKVAEEGSPAELLKKEDGLFRRMTKLQSAGAEWSI